MAFGTRVSGLENESGMAGPRSSPARIQERQYRSFTFRSIAMPLKIIPQRALTQWRGAAEKICLPLDEVHIWSAGLRVGCAALCTCWDLLSPEEMRVAFSHPMPNGGYTLEPASPGALEVSPFPHLGYSGGSPLRAPYRCAWPPLRYPANRA